MRRTLLLVLVGLLGLTQINCGSKSSPSSPGANASYSFITTLGQPGNGLPPTFYFPVGVAASGGKVYVSDYFVSGLYIEVFDMAGNLLTYFTPCDNSGTPLFVAGMSTDTFGHLYMAGVLNDSVDSFNLKAIPTDVSGEAVTAAFTYNTPCEPTDVKPDGNGVLYVADQCGEIFSLFQAGLNPGSGNGTSSGSASINGGLLGAPEGIAVNPAGTRIYVADSSFSVVQVYDGDFNWLQVIGDPLGASSTQTGKFDAPQGLAMDSTGNLFVADANNARVQKFSPGGTYQTSIGNTATNVSNGQLHSPFFLNLDENNSLFVTDTNYGMVFEYGTN